MSDTTISYLSQAFSTLRTPEEFGALLRDMCTLGELTAMAERLRVAEQLQRGVSYRDIAQSLGVSTTTVTRVAHWFHHGEGGYHAVLSRLHRKV